jgi:predicted transcriptional regulator
MLKRLMEILKEKGLDYNSFFFLYQLVNNINIYRVYNYANTADLMELEFIIENNEHSLHATQKGKDFIKEVIAEIKKDIQIDKKQTVSKFTKEVETWIQEYRDLFKNTKIGAIGDPKSCVKKMARFFDEYPDYADKDLIFKATQKYINSEATSNYKYLQRADYFIYKLTGKEEVSRLASFCSDIEENQMLDHSFTNML